MDPIGLRWALAILRRLGRWSEASSKIRNGSPALLLRKSKDSSSKAHILVHPATGAALNSAVKHKTLEPQISGFLSRDFIFLSYHNWDL